MAEYDAIADEYAASKLLPWRVQVEQPTLFGLIGDDVENLGLKICATKTTT